MTDYEIAAALKGKIVQPGDTYNTPAARERLAKLYREKRAYPRRGWKRGECIDCKAEMEGERRWETAMWICASCASKRRIAAALESHAKRPPPRERGARRGTR